MTTFDEGLRRWVEGLGRWRDVVRQRLVAEQLAAVLARRGPGPFRVLDVGCGQGTQALTLARAGHAVTGLDRSAALLDRFAAALADEPDDVASRVRLVRGAGEDAPSLTPGPFDLVCCHGVLMYVPDAGPLLAALSRVAAADGVLSLLVRNGQAMAMRDGLRGDFAAALAAFDRVEYVNRLGLSARGHTRAELDGLLDPHGWARETWFGVRVFTDHRDEPPGGTPGEVPGGDLDEVLAAERAAAGRDPYRQVAALLHVVYARPAAGPPPAHGAAVGPRATDDAVARTRATDDAVARTRATYDTVAVDYARQFADELDAKPLDRALLAGFVELTGPGVLADVGCGPGHVTRWLAARGADVVGVDVSPGMLAVARADDPATRLAAGSLLAMPLRDGALAGAVALYSIIHLDAGERVRAFAELARVVRDGGHLLVAFHVDSADFAAGEVNHLTTWFGRAVQLDGWFLDPDDVLAGLGSAGFALVARVDRAAIPGAEYPSRRCVLLVQRRAR